MPKTRSRFDKKNSITFKLVNRSQNDPLVADETAPQHVLVEMKRKDEEKRKEEQRKYGIYFDDNYDYLKHLKSREEFTKEWELVERKQPKNENKIFLPSSLFPSVIQEEDGMLNRAAVPSGPQPNWDPDVVAAMDEDFDFENPNNQIDDDFVLQAFGGETAGDEAEDADEEDENGEDEEDWEDEVRDRFFVKFKHQKDLPEEESNSPNEETEDDDEYQDFLLSSDENDDYKKREKMYLKEETKSVFTNYSMTSSVIPRNKGKTLIDEKFEALYDREYGNDMEIGALELDDIEGPMNPNDCPLLKKLIEKESLEKTFPMDKSVIVSRIRQIDTNDEDEEEIIEIEDNTGTSREKPFDCESILSTYSNLYNLPKLIRTERKNFQKLKINSATGIVNSDCSALTKKNLKQLDQENQRWTENNCKAGTTLSRVSLLSERPKDETPEARKERKAAFKAFKRDRRMEKKANKLAFKLEADKHNKELTSIKNSLNTMKLV